MVYRKKRTKHKRAAGASKYNNKKVEYDGHLFDSMGEKERYVELRLRERAGDISDLEIQVEYVLVESFKIRKRTIRKMTYTPDFRYTKDGQVYVEDFKGDKSEKYMIKRKLFLQRYGEECIFVESKKRKYSFSEEFY